MFKWTVNWRFVGEEAFLSKEFSLGLLVLHISLLAAFCIAWVKPSGTNVWRFLQSVIQCRQQPVALAKSFVMTVILSSLVIGLLCARSLHYQFFAYLAWTSPSLLWRAGLHPILVYGAWALQEWAWNVYPSTDASSAVVVFSLVLQVFGVWLNGLENVDSKPGGSGERRKARAQ